MAFLVIHLSERGRNNLSRLGAVVSLLLVLLGLTILGMSLFIRARIQAKLQLLENYNGSGFVYYLLVCGLMVAVVYTVAMKIFLDLGSYDTRFRWESQTRLFGVLLLVILLIIFACIIVVFTHQVTMKKYFETGVKTAMERYGKSPEIKRTIDEMQLEFQCCGSKEPQDWFTVAWIDNAYLDLGDSKIKHALRDGVYKGDHVPFSCCSVKAARPCIHRHVVNGTHAAYTWPKDSTLSAAGCAVALATEFGKTALSVVGYIVVVTSLLMISSLGVLKLLSTAISNTYPWGDPEGEAPTWLMEKCPVGLCDSETPEPPDEVTVVMPGAKLPMTKKKPIPVPEDSDDDHSTDAVDVPLLRKLSKNNAPNTGGKLPQKQVVKRPIQEEESDSSESEAHRHTPRRHKRTEDDSSDEEETDFGDGEGAGGGGADNAGKEKIDKDKKNKSNAKQGKKTPVKRTKAPSRKSHRQKGKSKDRNKGNRTETSKKKAGNQRSTSKKKNSKKKKKSKKRK